MAALYFVYLVLSAIPVLAGVVAGWVQYCRPHLWRYNLLLFLGGGAGIQILHWLDQGLCLLPVIDLILLLLLFNVVAHVIEERKNEANNLRGRGDVRNCLKEIIEFVEDEKRTGALDANE